GGSQRTRRGSATRAGPDGAGFAPKSKDSVGVWITHRPTRLNPSTEVAVDLLVPQSVSPGTSFDCCGCDVPVFLVILHRHDQGLVTMYLGVRKVSFHFRA